MNDPERLTELFFTELSDEAAVQIAEFFYELALCFESHHLGQILRHRRELDQQRNDDDNPNQRDLFASLGDPF